MRKTTISLFACAAIFAVGSTTTQALEINLPGVKIDDNGVEVGDVKISDEGIVIKDAKPGNASGRTIANADHSRSDYQEQNLSYARISGSDFSRSKFQGANFLGASFTNSDFSRSKFQGANLRGATFKNSDFSRSNFDGVNLNGTTFINSVFSRSSFIGACLYGAKFINSNFTRTKFNDATMTNTSNTRSDFARATLTNVDRESTCGTDSDGASVSVEESSSASVDISRVEIATATSILKALASGKNASISLTVNFALNSDQIEGRSRAQIKEIADALTADELAGTAILIEGHTDSSGQADYNNDLSYRRALRVQNLLVELHGVNGDRLTIEGLGESRPIASNASKAGRALNRRVTLVNRGHAQE